MERKPPVGRMAHSVALPVGVGVLVDVEAGVGGGDVIAGPARGVPVGSSVLVDVAV